MSDNCNCNCNQVKLSGDGLAEIVWSLKILTQFANDLAKECDNNLFVDKKFFDIVDATDIATDFLEEYLLAIKKQDE